MPKAVIKKTADGMADIKNRISTMERPTMTFSEKMVALMAEAQRLGIEFIINDPNSVTFCYNGDRERFSQEEVNAATWILEPDWEPWFFCIRREEVQKSEALAAVQKKIRETLSSDELNLLRESLREDTFYI